MNAKEALKREWVNIGSLRSKLPVICHGMTLLINDREYQAGSIVGYALERGDDPYKEVLRSEENGHTESRLWINACSICITNSREINERNARRIRDALKLKLGDLVIFEGNVVKLVKAPNQNVGLDFLSKEQILELM